MRMPLRSLALVGAALALPLALSACGSDSLPGNAVIKIGDDTIKTEAFNHWLRVVAISQAQSNGATTGAVTVPDPPNFTKCIAAKKKAAPKPAKGQPNPTDASYKTTCKTEYNGLRDTVMQFLISSAWIEGESFDRGIKMTDAAVKSDFDKQRNQSFPKDKDYLAFLKSSGYVQEDLLYRIKVTDLSNKLRAKIIAGADKVSDAAISNYYNSHKDSFAQPEKRDIRIVLTKTEGDANKAKSALDSGQSFKAVAAKYSIDQGTKKNGGLLQDVPKGQQEKALDAATFAADKGKITGPVKTQFGYYVFEVTKITAGTQQTLDQSKAAIRQLLAQQQQQKKLDAFVKAFTKKWKDRTECRSGYATSDCNNGPKAATTATTGAATQNAAPANSSSTTGQ